MLSVVLVEDEMLVLLGTKMCIQESGYNMNVIATFSTAEAAYDFFDSHTADVLVTDIRLPGMSGLELIEKIKPAHKHMIIIVLSCYEDFSYARRAYELGVDKYILKHELVEDELSKMILEIYESKKPQYSIKDTHINDFGIEFKRTGLIKTDYKYLVGFITMRGEIDDPRTDNSDISLPMVVEIIQEILHRDCLGECFLRNNDELFCVFNVEKALTYDQTKLRLENFFSNMSKNIKNYFNKYAYMTVSKSFTELGDVKTNFEHAKKSSIYTFYVNNPCILWAKEMKDCSRECPEIVFSPQNIFSNNWMSEFDEYIKDFFKTQKNNYTNPDELKIKVVRYVNEFSSFLSKYYDLDINHVFPKETRPDYFNINGFKNADGLRDWLIKMVKETREYILKNKKKENVISKIVEYVEQNYNTNISLAEIGEKFHMNPVYICQLFKKKMGVTLIYYINNLRIEKAKSLLLSTDLTAEQISEQVGIKNINYFFRLFKKSTGQTISQYRKSI